MLYNWPARLSRWFQKPQGRQPKRCPPSRRLPVVEELEQRLAPTVDFNISSTPFAEGDSGTSNLLFVVTRAGEMAQAVQVNYATQDGLGPNGAHAGTDYVATSGLLTFAAGQTTAIIPVPLIGNNLLQNNRTLTVALRPTPINKQPLLLALTAIS